MLRVGVPMNLILPVFVSGFPVNTNEAGSRGFFPLVWCRVGGVAAAVGTAQGNDAKVMVYTRETYGE